VRRRLCRQLLAFEVVDRLAYRRIVDHSGLGYRAGDQGGGADLMDPAGDALRSLGNALDGIVGKDGVPSSGVIDILRVGAGKCQEHWGQMDSRGLMQQLGAIPTPGYGGS
jgi:hypothetical protein